MLHTIFVSLSYMIGYVCTWIETPKQHPIMYYVLNTHHRRCDGDMFMQILPTTETSPERHCSIWWKQHVDQIILTKYQTIQKFILFYFISFFFYQVRYFEDMSISRFDLRNSWPRSLASQWPKSYMKQITQFIHTAFGSCKCFHVFFRHRDFIIWPWNFEVKVTAEYKEYFSVNVVAILMVIVAQTDSKHGINTCIGIYFFYSRLHLNVKITMKHSGH